MTDAPIDLTKKLTKPKGLWRETFESLLRKPSAVAGMIILSSLLLIAIFAPVLATHPPNRILLDIPEEGVVKRLDPCIHLFGCPKAGDELLRLRADEPISMAALNSTGSLIMAVSDTNIEVWRTQNGSKLFTLSHDEPIRHAAWSANDQRILTASGEQLFVWDVNTREPLYILDHPGGAIFVAWSRDGTRFASLGERDIHFWIDCKQIAYSMACSGGSFGATTQNKTFVNEGIGQLQEPWTSVQWDANGTFLMVAIGNKVQLWTSAGGVIYASATIEHEAPVTSARYNRESTRILTTSGNKLHIWRASGSYEELQMYEAEAPLSSGSWGEQTRQGQLRVLAMATSGNTLYIWDTRSGQQLDRVSAGNEPLRGAISPLATRYLGYSPDTVYVWDADTNEVLFSKELENDKIQNAVWQNTGGSVIVTGQQNIRILKTSNFQYLMGTDGSLRDEYSRLIYATRVSLRVGFTSVTFAILIGTFAGAVAGYIGGWADNIIMRVMDVMLAFPPLILAIAVVTILGPGLNNALIAISVVFIPAYARVVRSGVLSVKEHDFVMADRALGVSPMRILFRRILPNVMAPLIVQATLGIGTAILDAAALSFLGLGAQPPTAEWGYMLSEERNQLFTAPHLVFFPGVAIMITVLAFNLLGDGLRDALDPRLNR